MSEVARSFWNHAQDRSHFFLFSSALSSGSRLGVSAMMALLSVLLVFAGSLGYVSYSYHYSGLPVGAQMVGQDLSGLNRSETQEVLQAAFAKLDPPDFSVVLHAAGQADEVLTFSSQELEVSYDLAATVDQLYRISSSYSADLINSGSSDFSEQVYPVIRNKERIVDVVFEQILSRERDAELARLDFSAGEWGIVPEKGGVDFSEAEQAKLYERLMRLGEFLSAGQSEFSAEMTVIPASVTEADLQPILEQFTSQDLQRVVRWTLNEQEEQLLVAEHQNLFQPGVAGEWQVDEAALKVYVDEYLAAQSVESGNVQIKEPEIQEKGYHKSHYEGAFTPGRSFDENQVYEQLLSALRSKELDVTVELEYDEKNPTVEMEGVGKLELLSRGRSSYILAHSEDRTFNVKKGLGKYDGVVIPQGAEFSFNQILGRVTYEDGWKPALAIFGGGGVQPVPGGGLCQVSTTTFRAAINAGLQITARKPHSLDVSYYHQYGDGIDSTIYPPADIDLRFVNDTPGPIFIHTYTVDEVSEAFVEMYGISDGRSVELEQVINRPVNLPSETVYVSDLPAGVQEVIKPRAGRYIEWNWTVTRADGSKDERTVETLYPARRQTIRIGTGG